MELKVQRAAPAPAPPVAPPVGTNDWFRLMFEWSADALCLLDPQSGWILDANAAAVRLAGAPDKQALIHTSPARSAPERQPDGRLSTAVAEEGIREALTHGSHRYEWLTRRFDGAELHAEVVLTAIPTGERPLLLTVTRDITERKRAEAEVRRLNATLEQRIAERTAALSASEARLRTLVEHAPEAILVFDGETGRFLMCNENATRLYGLSREALLQLGPWDVSPEFQPSGERSSDLAREQMRRALALENPVFEWTHRHASGRLIPCEVRLVALPGEPRRLVRGSIIDNTERHRRTQIQQAIYDVVAAALAADDLASFYHSTHEIVRSLMPADNFYIALLDPAAGVISFPYHVDQRTPHPEPRPVTTGLTGEVLRLRAPLRVSREMDGRKRTVGSAVVIEGTAELPYVESGPPAAIWLGVPLLFKDQALGVMAVQDYFDPHAYGEEELQILTFVAGQIAVAIARKRTEQAVRESEQKFRALFEASSQGVLLHDEHQYLEVNPAALRILGYERKEQLRGLHPVHTSPPCQPDGEPSATAAQRHIADCMQSGTTRFEWTARSAQGRDIPLEVILTRVDTGAGFLIQAVIDDISERKQAEAELRRALERERELSQLKSRFVSMVSHEFRTPLGVIQSSAEILHDYLDQLAPAERQEHLQSIAKNTRRMAGLMEEVLVLGRLDSGKLDFQPAPLDWEALCRRIAEDVAAATDHRCPVDLHTEAFPGEALADERLVRHILTNLLMNAVKYSEPGSRVECSVVGTGTDAVMTVRDRGVGIPAADQPLLFTAFHRGSNVGQRSGTGLGLVIVQRCVELHGGRIGIESVEGQGTTVTVKLPVFARRG